MQIRVYYEDTDACGIVYHSNYLNFCERARSEMFFSNNLTPQNKTNFFVLKNFNADFLKSARLSDLLEVTTKILKIKNASVEMEQKIYKKNELIFKATLRIAYLENKKPSKIPEYFMEIFKNYLEGEKC